MALTDKQGRVVFGAELYGGEAEGATDDAVAASLGCGVPTAVADLHPGEVVLDLGSGAGAGVVIADEDMDQGLVTFSADMDFVCSQGGIVRRYNLASEPLAFAENEAVRGFLQARGPRDSPWSWSTASPP